MDLQFISCLPIDGYFLWQTELQLHNFREHGYSDKTRILIYVPKGRSSEKDRWIALNNKFPETKFFYFEDEKNECMNLIQQTGYIPILRPWMLEKHFTEFPELEQSAIFYIDSDVIFSQTLDLEQFLQDDVCYLSNTAGYMNLAYFEGKTCNGLPEKMEELRAEDPPAKVFQICGIDRSIVEANDLGTGGAQTILKGVNAEFWKDVKVNSLQIYTYLGKVAKDYFKSESESYQRWCADMHSLLYNLWRRGKKTETPTTLDFAWGTDKVERLKEIYIYHNAGISGSVMNLYGENSMVFYKGRYHNNSSPYKDIVYINNTDSRYCNSWYAKKLLEIENPIF